MGLVKVVNVSTMSVSVPDILVYLAGRGSEMTVSSDVIASSKDLSNVRHLVRLIPVVTEKKMPVWPFHKPRAPEPVGSVVSPSPVASSSAPVAPVHAVTDANPTLLSEIRDLLKVLVHQGSVVSPGAIQRALPEVTRRSDAPMFIPESIMPKDVEAKINLNSSDVQKPDFDSAKSALAKARKR